MVREVNQARELLVIKEVPILQEVWRLKAHELMGIKAVMSHQEVWQLKIQEVMGTKEMNRLELTEILEITEIQNRLELTGIKEARSRQEVSQLKAVPAANQAHEALEIKEVQDRLGIQVRENIHNKEEALKEAKEILEEIVTETEEVKSL